MQVKNPQPGEWAELEQDMPGFTPPSLADRLRGGEWSCWTKSVLSLTAESESVLDLGSGTGHLAAVLAAAGRRMTLMDLSQRNLDFSRELMQQMQLDAEYVCGDITLKLPFGDGAFDTAICCSVVQFFDDERILHLLREGLRVCRRRLIVTAPNSLCLAYRAGKRHMTRTGKWHWGVERSFRTFKPWLTSLGAVKVREFSVGTRHAGSFLTMPGGRLWRKALRLIGAADSSPAFLRQGYMLIAVAERL